MRTRPAAGLTAFAETTGRFLLLRRSRRVQEPGVWAAPAGRIDAGETPLEAAVREFREEAGYEGPLRVHPEPVLVQRGRRTFYHFVGQTPRQFRPKLNWESDDSGWFGVEGLPHPLHPGMLRLLVQIEAW